MEIIWKNGWSLKLSLITHSCPPFKHLLSERHQSLGQQINLNSGHEWVNEPTPPQAPSGHHCNDLTGDLVDGVLLKVLLEAISAELLAPLNKGRTRVHFVGNVLVSFDFLKQKVGWDIR